MTLLIVLGSPEGVHLSNDHKLSDAGKHVETTAATKQLNFRARRWQAKIAFTGIARDGLGYDTRAWLEDFLKTRGGDVTQDAFVAEMAERAAAELARVTKYSSDLTLVVGCATMGRCRLFMLSNFQYVDGNIRRATPPKVMLCPLNTNEPRAWVYGQSLAIRRHERVQLRNLLGSGHSPDSIREAMAAANARAASDAAFKPYISESCSVASLLADGTWAERNFGQAPGIPVSITGNADLMRDLIGTKLQVAPGKQPTKVQEVGFQGYWLPNALPKPGDNAAGQSWTWKHSEVREANGKWRSAITLSTTWGVNDYHFAGEPTDFDTREGARVENDVIAGSLAYHFKLKGKLLRA